MSEADRNVVDAVSTGGNHILQAGDCFFGRPASPIGQDPVYWEDAAGILDECWTSTTVFNAFATLYKNKWGPSE